jgi:hypothetical protein
MNNKSVAVLVAVVGFGSLVGCGAAADGTDGSATVTPTNHPIDASSTAKRVQVNGQLAIGPFALPSGATVTYTITDMPSGIGNDTMNFVVVSDEMVKAQSTQLTGYGVKTSVSSTTATTLPVPADSYDLVAQCNNLVDDCFFTDTVTAFY